ncbi:MAG: NAD(P)/FAD-dependent oxidoreductase, partial [Oscillospiraceae bacterium]|nr:NAD(P)/FAD-dependent oxidoreductase [Oscillospiraceae bacterium]
MRNYDVLIVGGGLLGCFAAREMSRFKLNTVLIEAREDVCTGISRANTAIVYSGYDTAPNTLKTEMCLRANRGFDSLCQELGVRFKRCGSLMISLGERGDEVLRKKYAQGLTNGVEGLELLSGEAVRALEPALSENVTMGLLSPTTGTVNPWELGIAAFENAAANGVSFRFGEHVESIRRVDSGYEVKSDKECCFARFIINCGGLFSDSVREMCASPLVRIFPKRGDYLIFDKSEGGIVSRVIFHEPEQKGKGLTAVPTTDGNLLIGPSELPFEGEADFSTTEEGIEGLLSLCGDILPTLDKTRLIRSFGTLRPNPFYVEKADDGSLIREKKGISSFTLLSDCDGSFLSFIGIKTPGLTCSRELGVYAAQTAAAFLSAEENPDFNPLRTPP